MSYTQKNIYTFQPGGGAAAASRACVFAGGQDKEQNDLTLAHVLFLCVCIQGARQAFATAEDDEWSPALELRWCGKDGPP